MVSPDGSAAAPPQSVRRSRQHLHQIRGHRWAGFREPQGWSPRPAPWRGGAVWSPTLLSIPPTASRGLCAPLPCTRGSAVWGFSPQPRSTTLLSVTPHCLQKSLCPGTGRRLSCSQMAWSWMSVAGLELKRRHCVRGRRWGAVGGALGVLGRELPALRAPVLGPWVCRPCGRLEISLSVGWVLGQRLSPRDVVPSPSTWDSGGEKAAWACGACVSS